MKNKLIMAISVQMAQTGIVLGEPLAKIFNLNRNP
jgi:hypothetical protein